MNKVSHYVYGLIALLCCSTISVAHSLPIESISILNNQQTERQQPSIVAKQWGLSVTDYQHYQQLMQQQPNQRWYRTLDPAEVLALNSQNDTEMKRYAAIQANRMHQRIAQELQFNQFYREAYHRLYPQEQPIQPNTHRSSINFQHGDHLWLFVNAHDLLLPALRKQLLSWVETKAVKLDIYVVGNQVTDQALQQWAVVNQLPNTVIQRSITLNKGNQRWTLIHQHQTYTLPFLAWVHNQRLQPLQWSQLHD